MFKYTLIFILIVFSNAFQIRAQHSHASQIDSLLDICHKRGIFNGNALVIKDQEVIYNAQKGFTDGSKTKALGKNSMFNIGSIAKEFNAVAIMMLQEKGALSLDDKLSKYQLGLPDWSDKITIKHLLQYTSGLPLVDWDHVHNDTDVYNDLKSLETLAFEPGMGYLYSNNNIFLQRRIIEKITGKTFQQFLTEQILQPIGMNTSVIDHQFENPNFVSAFNSEGVNDKKSQLTMSGWVCPSIDDLAKWANQLLSYKIISKESLYKLFEAYSEESQSALGNGTFTNGELTSYVHHGSSRNYESIVYDDLQENIMIVLMTNSKSLKIGEIAEAIIHIAKDEAFEIPQKSVYLTIREKTYQNVDEGIAYYKNLKKSALDTYDFSNQWELARLSYKLFEKNKPKDAIKILQLLVSELPKKSEETLGYLGTRILAENHLDHSILVYQLMVEQYPSGKSYSGLADAFYKDQQLQNALANYKKSVALQPENENAKKMILEIKNM